MSIRTAYEASLQRDGHVRDSAQEKLVDSLVDLQRQLEGDATRPMNYWRRAIAKLRKSSKTTKGLYIWGGVGRGKTFLMDLFFDNLQHPRKKRIHFHRMMQDIHARLGKLEDTLDPLDKVADDIAQETQVLCFDEFFVSDIGDAMILGRLLDGLFSRGVTLLATSNVKPDDLYRNGLQRQRFLPAIELLNHHTQVVEMDGGVDYRLQLLHRAGTWLVPNDRAALERLQFFFDESAQSAIRSDQDLDINGRPIRTRHCAKSIAWFDFAELCDGPRSQSDYIEISRWYPSIILTDVPQLSADLEDQARRFIAMVDEFYDRHVKLIVSSAVPVHELYTGKKLTFEIERTTSRLIEMQSDEYLALPHLA